MLSIYERVSALEQPLLTFPSPDTPNEQALIACATHVFLQTSDAPGALEALRLVLGPRNIEYLNVFLAFVRTAHYWTKLHPELEFEGDLKLLLGAHDVLRQLILSDPASRIDDVSRNATLDLAAIFQKR